MICLLLGTIAVSASAQVPPEEDAIKVSPQYYTVKSEPTDNLSVRFWPKAASHFR
jgi:hypothetical protein